MYPVRWESLTSGKSGCAPACAKEWRAAVCEKPRIKCGDCSQRLLIPLPDSVIYDHLAGKQTVGVYPLLDDDTCHFLAVDFDEAEWQQDVLVFMQFGCVSGAGNLVLGAGRSRMGVCRRTVSRSRCASPGHCQHQPDLRALRAAQAGVLRPLVSQTEHHAQRRLWRPD